MKANPDKVKVKIGFRTYKPKLVFIEDITEKTKILQWYTKSFPKAAKGLFGYDDKKDTPDEKTLKPIAEHIMIVKLIMKKKEA